MAEHLCHAKINACPGKKGLVNPLSDHYLLQCSKTVL
jgi:hypothetical protein